jgi:hypothetical protein
MSHTININNSNDNDSNNINDNITENVNNDDDDDDDDNDDSNDDDIDDDDIILDISLPNTAKAKLLFEMIKSFSSELIMKFSMNGFTIKTMNDGQTTIIDMIIPSDDFDIYLLKDNFEFSAGVDMDIFYNFISTIDNKNKIRFIVTNTNKEYLRIDVNSPKCDIISSYYVPLCNYEPYDQIIRNYKKNFNSYLKFKMTYDNLKQLLKCTSKISWVNAGYFIYTGTQNKLSLLCSNVNRIKIKEHVNIEKSSSLINNKINMGLHDLTFFNNILKYKDKDSNNKIKISFDNSGNKSLRLTINVLSENGKISFYKSPDVDIDIN